MASNKIIIPAFIIRPECGKSKDRISEDCCCKTKMFVPGKRQYVKALLGIILGVNYQCLRGSRRMKTRFFIILIISYFCNYAKII